MRGVVKRLWGHMDTVQFNEEPKYARQDFDSEKPSWLANMVIRTGLAKNNAGAQKVLLVVFLLAVLATILIWIPWGSLSSSAPASGSPSASPHTLP